MRLLQLIAALAVVGLVAVLVAFIAALTWTSGAKVVATLIMVGLAVYLWRVFTGQAG